MVAENLSFDHVIVPAGSAAYESTPRSLTNWLEYTRLV